MLGRLFIRIIDLQDGWARPLGDRLHGNSPSEIGRMLGISVHTVRRHVANLSDKLGLRGAGALTRYAIQHGLIRET